MIIRDVCEPCNNGPLSLLDAYACELYDTNFGKFPEHSESVALIYDYGRLLRWLIKIAYNTVRANGHQDAELLSRYRGSLLTAADNSPIYVNAYVALTGPGTLDFRDRPSRKIHPQLARSCSIRRRWQSRQGRYADHACQHARRLAASTRSAPGA